MVNATKMEYESSAVRSAVKRWLGSAGAKHGIMIGKWHCTPFFPQYHSIDHVAGKTKRDPVWSKCVHVGF